MTTQPIIGRDELKRAFKAALFNGSSREQLSNGWWVTHTSILKRGWGYIQMRYLESPTGKTFGGISNVAQWVETFLYFDYRDEYPGVHDTRRKS